MKDLVITPKRLKKEIYILLACFATAFLANIGAIIYFKTPWVEVFTQIGYVIVITIGLFVIVSLIRFIILLIRKLIRK